MNLFLRNAQRLALCGVGLLLSATGFAQEPIVVSLMHYNLLNYNNSSFQCDGTTNSVSAKDDFLKTIIDFTEPDIFTVNELGSNFANANRIVQNALNVNGRTSFKQCNFSNNGFSEIVNMLFYDSDLFELHEQAEVSQDLNGSNLVRVIDIYSLYYKDPNLAESSDTTFLHIVVAHLKAGDSNADQQQRDLATEALMDFLDTEGYEGNILLAGDLNVQSSSEDSFDNMISYSNPDVQFQDPIDELGSWNNNSSFASIHTQSTRSNNTNGGCFAGGGMDDRFDFILANRDVMDDLSGVEYISNSYSAVGQDGNRFNGSINSPNNFTASSDVIDALFGLSDHLPVRLSLRIDQLPVGLNEQVDKQPQLNMANPVQDELAFSLSGYTQGIDLNAAIYSVDGRLLMQKNLTLDHNKGFWNLSNLPQGAYLLKLWDNSGLNLSRRIIKI